MEPKQSLSQVLQAARALVAAGWCQGPYYQVIDGQGCYCVLGAVARASGEDNEQLVWFQHAAAEAALDKAARRLTGKPRMDAVSYNEAAGRTKEEVLRMFDLALEEVTK